MHTVVVELQLALPEVRESHMFRGIGDGLDAGAWKAYPHSCESDEELPSLIDQAKDFVHNQHAIHLTDDPRLIPRATAMPLAWRIIVDGENAFEGEGM